MSAKKRNDDTFLVWDEMIEEASITPLKMQLPNGETAIIEQPTGDQSMKAEELSRRGDGTSREQLRLLLGDAAWEQLEPFVLSAPVKTSTNLIAKVMKHFEIGGTEDAKGEGGSPT